MKNTISAKGLTPTTNDPIVQGDVSAPFQACVFCNGGVQAIESFRYVGIQSCAAAMVVAGGHKACTYGCLGFGDCVAVCQYGALTMTDQGLPKVDRDRCVNCGACYAACPKKIIRAIPKKMVKTTQCSSHDVGKAARSTCTAACIACGTCVKTCPFKAISLQNNLSVIDPLLCTNCGSCVPVCPTKAIR